MSHITRHNLEQLLGPVDENTVRALQATGANLKDIEQAKSLADQKSDITGFGEQSIPKPVEQVLLILTENRQ